MASTKASILAPKRSKLGRAVSKVLHLRSATGIAPFDGVQNFKRQEKVNKAEKHVGKVINNWPKSFIMEDHDDEEEELRSRQSMEALVAKLFSSTSSVKAAYAQLQYAQSPYDAEGIQTADQIVVSELKKLSEMKQCYVKKQFDPSPGKTIIRAEIEELKSLIKTYEMMGKRLESQFRLKESEILYLKEKLEECQRQNRSLEKRLNQSGQLNMVDKLPHSGPSHFITVLQHTVKSIRSFVKLLIAQMRSTDWDLEAAAGSIVSDVIYSRADDKCYVFESFVCRVMFEGFHLPSFSHRRQSLPEQKNQQQNFLRRFTELKSVKVMDYLAQKPKSAFAKFCRARYLHLVHPKMEISFFGNSSQRSLLDSGEFPESTFFASFAEMARRVWLLNCLAFSFNPQATIFQVQKGCNFSEVYMECVDEEATFSYENAPEADPPVAFTVVPGFRIGKTVIQCQVYLSQVPTK
ncbi:hypothetical protein K2173_022597 [Erythroxylum novogranatense]|uniref:DUF641 domain-containing protein n=1 Tax=Erythroxylum novogranatense TaxID=1862640 RepID=A0AAV8SV05_9ROSI|nr:hypothetical protein K2173_022597 [Erythroxylum novogranatense]